MEIRKIAPTDNFDDIARIYVRSWRHAYINIVPQQYLDELSENHFANRLKNNYVNTFVMIENGEYIGASSISAARDEKMSGWGEIPSIYLLPEYIRKGFGKLLLDNSVAALLNMGYDKIYLWVLEANTRARRFYEKNGFAFSGDKKDKMVIDIGGKDLPEVRYIYI